MEATTYAACPGRLFSAPARGAVPLAMAPKGTLLEIQRVQGKDEVRAHLARLGFVPGAHTQVVSEAAGNLILDVKGSRLALSRGLAHRIQVAPVG